MCNYLVYKRDAFRRTAADRSEKPMPRCLSREPNDQKFLDLAHRAKADALVTGDRVLLEPSGEPRFGILTPAQVRGRLDGREDE